MANQSGFSRFQPLFDTALQAYQEKTGIDLPKHPLALQLESCHSAEDVIKLLHSQAQAFTNFQESDRIIKSIKSIVLIVSPLYAAASLADASGVVCQRALVAFSIFLTPIFTVPTRESYTHWSRYPT
jgi:hypothetical protein